MILRYRSGGRERGVRVEPTADGYRVELEGRSFAVQVRRRESHLLDLTVDDRAIEAIVVRDGALRFVKAGDADPVTLMRSEGRAPGTPAALDGRLTAIMDGQVVTVLARPGEIVEAGTTLALLEAMKMEMRVVAPFRGRVRGVFCASGDVVQRGRVLIEMEPEAPGGSGSP